VRRSSGPSCDPTTTPGARRRSRGSIRDAGESLVVTTEKDLVKWRVERERPVRALRIGLSVERGDELLDLVLGTSVLCG
jgi:hypothetical protein